MPARRPLRTDPSRARRPLPPQLCCEPLEDRITPVSQAPGDYSGAVAGDWEFDQPGEYRVAAALTVGPGAALTVGTTAAGQPVAGVRVVLADGGAVRVAGGRLAIDGAAVGGGELEAGDGSAVAVRHSAVAARLTLAGSAAVSVAGNDLTDATVTATGAGGPIDLTGNWWGTTDPADIDARVTDAADDPARPAVAYQPVLAGRPVRVTAAAGPAVTYSAVADRGVELSATFADTPSGPVTDGTATFTLLDAAGDPVGTPPAAVPVADGSAAVTYTLPAGTPAGTYAVRVEYGGSAARAPAAADAALTVTPAAGSAAVALTPGAGGVGYRHTAQKVGLMARVTSRGGGPVNGGTVTFVVRDGEGVLGTPTAEPVADGWAVAEYDLPARLLPGDGYTIAVEYAGANFAVPPAAVPLTVGAADTTTIADPIFGTYAPAVAVELRAAVASSAGVVNAGSVTFTVRDAAGAEVATLADRPVAIGAATVRFTPPAAGVYAVTAAYTSPDPFVTGSASAPAALTVDRAATATAAAAAAVTAGQSVALTASVTSPAGPVAGGTVTFTLLGTTVAAAVSDGTATAAFAVPAGTPAGAYPVAAAYAGGTNFDPSAGGATLAVAAAPVEPPPSPPPVGVPMYAAGADAGGSGAVTVYGPGGTPAYTVEAFPGTTGGTRPVVADFTGDGTPDLAVAAGPGAAAEVVVYDGATRAELFRTRPFGDFAGGLFVAAGDLTADGRADLVVTPDQSGGPRVTVYRGGDFAQLANFFGIDDPDFRGGARPAVGDINADGFADLVVAAGFGGGPRVALYDGRTLAQSGTAARLTADFFLFEEGLRNGAYVAVGDLDGDGRADLVGGGGPGGGPRVLALAGADLLAGGGAGSRSLANFFAGDTANRGGVRVAVKDLDGDARADLVVGAGTGAGSRVTAYLGKDLSGGSATPFGDFDAIPGFAGGVFVG